MGKDISEGIKVALVLVILCAMLTLLFVLIYIVRDFDGTSSHMLQQELHVLVDSELDIYDQKIVTGAKIKVALEVYSDASCVVRSLKDNVARVYGRRLVGTKEDNTIDWSIVKEGDNTYWTAELSDGVNGEKLPLDDKVDNTYVRDSAKYLSELIKDSNGTTIGMFFTEIK